MATRGNKVFRVETMGRPASANDGAPVVIKDVQADLRHREIMKFLKQIKEEITPAEKITEKVVEDYKLQMEEARKLKAELDEMYQAINETKQEIATLHQTGFKSDEMGRVTNELDAIVSGTENATEGILAAAETIDTIAADLFGKYADTDDGAMINDIQENTVKIFEHCNFQDLTGQRITKVVNVLAFVEARIVKMMEIWGGLEVFKEIEGEKLAERTGEAALLNGPALEGDEDVASQDDIDALFA